MRHFFVGLFSFLSRRKFLLFSMLTGIVVFVIFFASKLRMNEDIMAIMPKTEESERVSFVMQNLKSSEKIIVKIAPTDSTTAPNPDLLIECANQLVDSLNKLCQDSLIKEVFYQIEPSQMLEVMDFIFENLPYYMTETDYERVDSLIAQQQIGETLARNKRQLTSPIGMVYRTVLLRDPLHLSNSILLQLNEYQTTGQYTNYDGYIFSKEMDALFLFITPIHPSSETAQNKYLVEEFDRIVNVLNCQETKDEENQTSEIQITYFGAVAVAVANASQIKRDSLISIIIAVILIALILATYFKNIRSVVLLMLPVAFGGFLSLAALYFIKDTISAIAIGTGSIVFGIAIDYSLHFLIHLRQTPSIKKTIKEVAFPLIVGSGTTIAAFLTLIFLKSELLEDFGLFAAFTLIGTILFTLIFLPQLISQKKVEKEQAQNNTIWNRIANYSFENNRWIILGITTLTVVFAFYAGDVKFEEDLHKINYMTESQRKALTDLSPSTTLSQKLTYYANESETMEEALQQYEQHLPLLDSLKKSGVVTACNHIGHLLPSKAMQATKINQWNNFWAARKDIVKKSMIEEGNATGFNTASFDDFFQLIDKTFEPQEVSYFEPLQKAFLDEYLINKDGRSIVLSMIYTLPDDAELLKEGLSKKNNGFYFDTTTLAKSMLSELSNEFNYLLWICGAIVLLFLFFSFGRIEITLIAFLPMACAFIWILGIMAITDIRFNIINIILSAFIFGIGDDYSIFIMEGLLYEYTYRKKMLNTYKTAVILSAVTMFVGIGALIIAKHPAMFSLAQVTIIGMIVVAILSYTVSPFLFKLITRKKGKDRLIPVTLWNFFKTIFSFIVFLFGSIVLTLIGFFLLTIGGKTEKNQYRYHLCLCTVFKWLSAIMPQVRAKIINPNHETFEKPGLIICNHQSHLDLLYTLSLTPKVIVLTNRWAWDLPFYGWILRYASFFPNDNIEGNFETIQEKVSQGYSVLVFPEGTRSENCSILRFHKGAFYLAEKLKLDIIPIVLHGIGHIFPKKEFLLRKGSVTVKILNRITSNDTRYWQFEELYKTTQAFRALFKEEYQKIAEEFETPEYFQSLVLYNYIYKGATIERNARKSIKRNKGYASLISQLPDSGKILIQNCRQGEFTLLLSLVKKKLNIVATDNDADLLEVALHCNSKPENIDYVKQPDESVVFDKRYNLIYDKQQKVTIEEF